MIIPYRQYRLLGSYARRGEEIKAEPDRERVMILMNELFVNFPQMRSFVRARTLLDERKKIPVADLKADIDDFLQGIARAMAMSDAEMRRKGYEVSKKKVSLSIGKTKSDDKTPDPTAAPVKVFERLLTGVTTEDGSINPVLSDKDLKKREEVKAQSTEVGKRKKVAVDLGNFSVLGGDKILSADPLKKLAEKEELKEEKVIKRSDNGEED